MRQAAPAASGTSQLEGVAQCILLHEVFHAIRCIEHAAACICHVKSCISDAASAMQQAAAGCICHAIQATFASYIADWHMARPGKLGHTAITASVRRSMHHLVHGTGDYENTSIQNAN